MQIHQLIVVSILLILMSCETIPVRSNDAVSQIENRGAGASDSTGISFDGEVNHNYLESIRPNFIYQNIENFTFTENGRFNHEIDKLPKVDGSVKAKILKSMNQTNWSGHCDVSYFSTYKIDDADYGIFLLKRDFDGLTYDFVMIQFHDDGSILFCDFLASWSEAAECIFFTNAKITKKKIKKLNIEKCYDFELDAKKTNDSTEIHYEIANKGLKEIRKVRLI